MAKRLILLALLCALLSGCGVSQSVYDAAIQKMISAKGDQYSRDYIRLLHEGQAEKALQLFEPGARATVTLDKLGQQIEPLRAKSLSEVKPVGYQYFELNGKKSESFTYQVKADDRWVTVDIVLHPQSGDACVYALRVQRIPAPLNELNAFSLGGKPAGNYVFLLCLFLTAAFSLACLVICLRSQIRRKWLWALLCFAGIGQLSLNWSSGEFYVNPFWVTWKLFAVQAVSAGPYSPWWLNFTLPAGAALFLIKRRKLLQNYRLDIVTPAGETAAAPDLAPDLASGGDDGSDPTWVKA